MLNHRVKGFNTYWGTGERDSLFEENEVAGRGNRQKGFPKTMLIAAALDPRSKSLKYLGPKDKSNIWDEIKCMMRLVSDEIKKKPDIVDLVGSVRPPTATASAMSILLKGMGDDDDDEEDASISEGNRAIGDELERYRTMKSLLPQHADGTFSDPLAWWQMNEELLQVLSIIARRLLCVPATSAPSERVFSVAGLTISKCRTSVQPQHASELIFLHDSWPLAEICEKEFEEKKK